MAIVRKNLPLGLCQSLLNRQKYVIFALPKKYNFKYLWSKG